MYWQKTKCFLCGKEAEKLFSFQNLRIRCEHCNTYYSFSSLIAISRLDEATDELLYRDYETGKKRHIPTPNKLIDYVKKRTDVKGRLPFLITPQILDDLYNK
jgi:hypothetical protein